MVWVCVSASVSVWFRSLMVMVLPSAVWFKLMVSVGVNTWCIGPTCVLASTVNVGVMSKEYSSGSVVVPVSLSMLVIIGSVSASENGARVMLIVVWFVVVWGVLAVWYCHAAVRRVRVTLYAMVGVAGIVALKV